MALVFRVGTAADVFAEPFAAHLVAVMEQHFGTSMRLGGVSDDDGWASEELGWSYLQQLQSRANASTDPKAIEHLLAMPSWRGAFLPVETITGELSEIWEPDEPIAIASLLALERELHHLAPILALPLGASECRALMAVYVGDDEKCDDDPDVQTWTQLVIGIQEGIARQQPLWVIK